MNTPHFIIYARGLNEEVYEFLCSSKQADDERSNLIEDVSHEIENIPLYEGYDPENEETKQVLKELARSLELLREGQY